MLLNLSELRRLVVAHQTEGVCTWCDDRFVEVVRTAFKCLGYERIWICEVTSSGYHNGCKCSPDEPHDDRNCRYVWKGVALTDNGARKVGL